MRKRPNYSGIEEIRQLPSACTNCNAPLFDGCNVLYEINSNSINCEKCIQKEDCAGPEIGVYTLLEDFQVGTEFYFFKDDESMSYFE